MAKLRKATVCFVMSVCPSVRMEQLDSHWTDFYECLYLCIFRKSVERIQISLNLTTITGNFNEDQYTFLIIFCPFLHKMRSVYENAGKYLDPNMTRITMWCMGIACWIPKSTDTHAECVILIAFPLQQWLL
jgi:hypothetical protein